MSASASIVSPLRDLMMAGFSAVSRPNYQMLLDMEIDLYTDLTAFNSLSREQQEAEVDRLGRMPAPTSSSSRVVVAAPPAPAVPLIVDSPGSVILRAEDLLAEEDFESEPPRVEDQGKKVEMNDNFRTSGPLTHEMPSATQHNPGLVACSSCGSESDAQDLFCIECGAFLNQSDAAEVEVQGSPACTDCGAIVEPGEIFCPSCGCALPG
jgi:hypothetical protein